MVVPAMGTATERAIEKCVEWINELGYGKIILKSDQGKAVAALSEEIKRFKHAARDDTDVIIEHSEVRRGVAEQRSRRASGQNRRGERSSSSRCERSSSPWRIASKISSNRWTQRWRGL